MDSLQERGDTQIRFDARIIDLSMNGVMDLALEGDHVIEIDAQNVGLGAQGCHKRSLHWRSRCDARMD